MEDARGQGLKWPRRNSESNKSILMPDPKLLMGGIHDPNDPLNTYKSLDGLTTYVLSGTDLIVNGVLMVNDNFQSGQFGIQLDDLSDYPMKNCAEEYRLTAAVL